MTIIILPVKKWNEISSTGTEQSRTGRLAYQITIPNPNNQIKFRCQERSGPTVGRI
jgi:hypothetical protein